MVQDDSYSCRVCGYRLGFKPWGEDGKTPPYEICPCCGAEFGNDDYTVASTRDYRKKWVKSGCAWFDAGKKPNGWSCKSQMKNIPERFR